MTTSTPGLVQRTPRGGDRTVPEGRAEFHMHPISSAHQRREITRLQERRVETGKLRRKKKRRNEGRKHLRVKILTGDVNAETDGTEN